MHSLTLMYSFLQRLRLAPAIDNNSNLCTVCQSLLTGRRIDKALGVTATANLAQTFVQLEDSVRNGCRLCRLRWNGLTSDQRSELRLCEKVTFGFWQSSIGDGVVFEYWLDNKFAGMKPWLSLSVLMKAKAEVPTGLQDDYKAGSSTASPAALNAACKQYLWIDSLCIVQDSKEDWEREATLMERVYEYSYCNISAVKAANTEEGIFSIREPSLVRPVEVKTRWWPSLSPTKYYFWDPNIWDSNVDDSILLHRAWVTQERVLAPRILHFAEGQIFWECCSLRACETYPLGIPNNTSYKPSLDSHPLARQVLHSFQTPAVQRYHLWKMYVQLYTDSDLTNKTQDKFLAISGLARKIGPPQDYVAGLWKPIFRRQLRWQAGEGCTRQQEWRAPTWSWASLDGLVYLEAPDEPNIEVRNHFTFDVIDIRVTLATNDPFGPVLPGAALLLKASLLHVTVYKSDMHPVPVCIRLGGIIHAHVRLDVGFVQEGQTLFCMPLHIDLEKNMSLYGVVLEPVANREPGVFYRCGVFYVSNMEPGDQWVEMLSGLLKIGTESRELGKMVGRLERLEWRLYEVTLL
ncbi:hypothetical protein DV736_g2094, partial [Chaetothyriales sp. CBS 134916]